MSVTLRPCLARDAEAFCLLLTRYFREDLHLPVSDAQAWELACDIREETALGVALTLAVCRQRPVGFINYQVDADGGSWCWHPGWGCIRECYVLPEYRRQGIARALACHAEKRLAARGVGCLYLTADDAIPFWQRLGYRRTGRINEKNGLEELEKPL